MEFLASWTGLLAVGCTLAMSTIGSVALLDANRRVKGVRKSNELEADIGRMASERNSLTEEVARLRADRDALAGLEEQKSALQSEITVLTTQLEIARKRVEDEAETLKKAEELDQQIADRLTRCSEAEQSLLNLRDQLATKEAELKLITSDLEEKTKQRDAVAPELVDLTARRDALRQEAAQDRAQIEELSRTRQQEEMRAAEARLRHDTVIEEIDRLERRRRELRDELESLQANRAALVEVEKATQRLERARQEAAGVEAKIVTLQAEVTALKAQRDGLGGPLQSENEEALGGLTNAPSLLLAAKRPIENIAEDDALRVVKDVLKQRGLEFPDRIVNAFHTSLKISAISPLTVLAGISGTGKSELPRQYAIGMGLPFLQLAVQPRWDSPQDLFGFYNYMEKKYKPTELVRLMVHLDAKNWPEEAKAYKDHMALVLLDEMNLARVEYYFSEFLSRLEIRRGGDGEAAAEIELDLGLSAPKKVYPVSRLLFVGTMNEDESTQTLSDKVVDRANVLRFPRPKILKSATVGTAKATDTDRFLPFSVWSKWSRTVDARSGSRVDGWLKRLNDAMEQAGRPFGHRMAKAIAAYVANYPKGVADAEAIAMADQLEMRLFPKLRGVDPKADDRVQRALDDLRQFIEAEIRDSKLVEAFDAAKDGDLFAWRGVDRG
jgi:hypothetical protein